MKNFINSPVSVNLISQNVIHVCVCACVRVCVCVAGGGGGGYNMCLQSSLASTLVLIVLSKLQQVNSSSISSMFPEKNYMTDTNQFVSDLVQTLIWFF